MNVLQNLIELYNTLPLDSTYRAVAKGILENLNRMRDVTVYDIAEITCSSRTTVWRMVQKMGYKNFSDFRHALQSAVTQYNYYNRMLPTEATGTPDMILQAVTGQLQESIDVLEQSMSPQLLADLAEQLHMARRVRFYMPFHLVFTGALQQNLAMDGKDTALFSLLPDMTEDARELDENSILLISTIEFAETMDLREVFELARQSGAVIWLAGNSHTQYRRYADLMLLDTDATPFGWLTALDGVMLALSEQYRRQYIDR